MLSGGRERVDWEQWVKLKSAAHSGRTDETKSNVMTQNRYF